MTDKKQKIDIEDAVQNVAFCLDDIYRFNDMLTAILDNGVYGDVERAAPPPNAFLAVVETMADKSKERVLDAAKELSKLYPSQEDLQEVISMAELDQSLKEKEGG